MSASGENEQSELRFAEYVLGVLDADERAAVAHEAETRAEAAIALQAWQRRLMPLAEPIAALAPAPYVWARICDALQMNASDRSAPRRDLWNDLRLWRSLGVGALALSLGLAFVRVLPHAPRRTRPGNRIEYMAATLQQTDGVAEWTATMDLRHARMVVVPATPAPAPAGRAAELWLIPVGKKPVAVGMIALDRPTTIALNSALMARLGPTATLAVSMEPAGGSPTGEPSGPVVAKGAIGAA